MMLRQLLLLAALVARVSAVGEDCVEYIDYLSELDYCADPLYWSNYKIRKDIDLLKAQTAARAEYDALREGIWNNAELILASKIDQSLLADCMGMAQRVACHRNIPRCSGGEDTQLCSGLCETFHKRCTIGTVNFLVRGMEKEYLPECTSTNTAADHCSSAARGRTLSLAVAAGLVLGASMLLSQQW